MVGFDKGQQPNKSLDGLAVPNVNPDLSATADITLSERLATNERICFMGPSPKGPFDIDEQLALSMIDEDENNRLVVRPVWSATDIVRNPRNKWTVDFGLMTENEAKRFKAPYVFVKHVAFPIRSKNRRKAYATYWWQYAEARPGMRKALKDNPDILLLQASRNTASLFGQGLRYFVIKVLWSSPATTTTSSAYCTPNSTKSGRCAWARRSKTAPATRRPPPSRPSPSPGPRPGRRIPPCPRAHQRRRGAAARRARRLAEPRRRIT